MAYGVFESTNMRSTHAGGRVYDAIADYDVENGTVGHLEGVVNGETVVYKFVKGLAKGKAPVIVDQPAGDDDTSRTINQRKDKFIVEAGTKFRARKIYNDDKFAVSIDCIATADQEGFDAGKTVTVDQNGKFTVVSESAEGEDPADNDFEGVVRYKRTQGNVLVTTAHNYGYSRYMYVIEVTKLV